MKPLNKTKIAWCPKLAYAVGLIATDGNLSRDGRHIIFTSKDQDLAKLFNKCLGIKCPIAMKSSGSVTEKRYCYVQFSDVAFYKFLEHIGIHAAKSKTMGRILVPNKFFFDFLRGLFDGDGTFYSYWDPRWRSSFMYYVVFISASQAHILWLQQILKKLLGIQGHITKSGNDACYQLKYAKAESRKLLPKMYCRGGFMCLGRKYLKIKDALAIIGERIK